MFFRDILRVNANNNVPWQNVKGHEATKSILIESVVMPLQYPELFSGIMKPWNCVLLHGPPGKQFSGFL